MSNKSITATGYHCFVQLNVPAPGVSPLAAASTIGTRSGVMPISGFAADASDASSSDVMVEPPTEAKTVTLRTLATGLRVVALTEHARFEIPRPTVPWRDASELIGRDVIIINSRLTTACPCVYAQAHVA